MPNRLFQNSVKNSLVLVSVILISWFPVFLVPFLNDDYQIITFYYNKNFFELFRVFWEQGVYYYYWRPIPDFIHGLTLLTGGFYAPLFRIAGIIIYIITSLQIYRTFKLIGLRKNTAFLSALLFGVLPSHVFEAAWIADQLESLVACFLLLSFINYLKAYEKRPDANNLNKPAGKYLGISAAWFIAALLTKEIAYTGIFIPAAALICCGKINKRSLFITIRDLTAGLLILLAIFLYRILVIGGTPFSASHFNNLTGGGMIKNFFIYIPLAFSPPEVLEALYNISNLFLYSVLFLILLIVFLLSIRKFKLLNISGRKIIYTGAAWFIIFIIPALPTLMRWYVFTASIGLILILAVLVENLLDRKFFLGALTGLLLVFCFYDFSVMLDWKETGRKTDEALSSLKNQGKNISSDTLYLWGVPDKFKRVPMMKLGIEQSVKWALGKTGSTKIQVNSPLRSELIGSESKIILKEKSGSSLVLILSWGRFLLQGGESKSVIKDEKLFYKAGGVEFNIQTGVDSASKPVSYALVRLSANLKGDHFYFDGRKFIFIDSRQ